MIKLATRVARSPRVILPHGVCRRMSKLGEERSGRCLMFVLVSVQAKRRVCVGRARAPRQPTSFQGQMDRPGSRESGMRVDV